MPFNPKSLENLKPIEKGSSLGAGNNKGSQLRASLTKLLNNKMIRGNPLDGGDLSCQQTSEHLNLALIAKALDGDIKAISVIYDRIEGKVTQNINVNTEQASIDEIKKQMMENLESENGGESDGK